MESVLPGPGGILVVSPDEPITFIIERFDLVENINRYNQDVLKNSTPIFELSLSFQSSSTSYSFLFRIEGTTLTDFNHSNLLGNLSTQTSPFCPRSCGLLYVSLWGPGRGLLAFKNIECRSRF